MNRCMFSSFGGRNASIDSQIEHGRTASSHAGQVDGRIRAPRCTRAIGSAACSLALRSFGGCGRRPSGRAFPAPTGRDCACATCLPLAHRQLQICVLHRAAKQHRPSHITRQTAPSLTYHTNTLSDRTALVLNHVTSGGLAPAPLAVGGAAAACPVPRNGGACLCAEKGLLRAAGCQKECRRCHAEEGVPQAGLENAPRPKSAGEEGGGREGLPENVRGIPRAVWCVRVPLEFRRFR